MSEAREEDYSSRRRKEERGMMRGANQRPTPEKLMSLVEKFGFARWDGG